MDRPTFLVSPELEPEPEPEPEPEASPPPEQAARDRAMAADRARARIRFFISIAPSFKMMPPTFDGFQVRERTFVKILSLSVHRIQQNKFECQQHFSQICTFSALYKLNHLTLNRLTTKNSTALQGGGILRVD